MFSAARHLFGAAVVRTRWPRGHWSLLFVRHGRGAVRKVHARRRLIATPRGGNVGRSWLPVWLPDVAFLRSPNRTRFVEQFLEPIFWMCQIATRENGQFLGV